MQATFLPQKFLLKTRGGGRPSELKGDPLFHEETSQEGHTLLTKCHHLRRFSSKQPKSSHCPYFHLTSVDITLTSVEAFPIVTVA